MFTGWKSQIDENTPWATKPCPCWCSGWADVLIRGPSGDVAWIMRTENLPYQTESQNEPAMPHITLLFSPVELDSPDTFSKLDSSCLREEYYNIVHAGIFGSESKCVCFLNLFSIVLFLGFGF